VPQQGGRYAVYRRRPGLRCPKSGHFGAESLTAGRLQGATFACGNDVLALSGSGGGDCPESGQSPPPLG